MPDIASGFRPTRTPIATKLRGLVVVDPVTASSPTTAGPATVRARRQPPPRGAAIRVAAGRALTHRKLLDDQLPCRTAQLAGGAAPRTVRTTQVISATPKTKVIAKTTTPLAWPAVARPRSISASRGASRTMA